jgi:hypothetical protein
MLRSKVALVARVVLDTCAKAQGRVYSPESPPVMGLVPLNSVGGPVCEYDMVAEFPGG